MTRPDGSGGTITHVHPWAAALVAIGLAAAIAWIVAGPVFRLRGHYLAMATLGFGIIVHRIFLGSPHFGAADGISDVPALALLPGFAITGRAAARVSNYYAAWGLVLLTLWMLSNLIDSRVGRALRAIHGSENAASAVGIPIARFKTQVFVLAAVLAARRRRAAHALQRRHRPLGGLGHEVRALRRDRRRRRHGQPARRARDGHAC